MLRWFNLLPHWTYLALLAAVPRFTNLAHEALWYDETFTAWIVSRLDLPGMWQAIMGDVHPPLWYVIERVVVSLLGASEFALRLPAALLGVATVLLVWRIALALRFNRCTAFTAGVLAAILPAALYYSQDARMYALLATFVLLAVWGLIRFNWLLFVVGSIGAVYTHNLGVFYVAALGLVAVAHARLRALLALMFIVIAWLPWAGILLAQARAVADGFWIEPLSPGGIIWPFASMTMGWRASGVFQIHIYGAALGASIVGLLSARRWLFRRDGLIVLAAIFGAPGLLALVSVFWRSIYLPRALLPSTLLLMLLWAWALHHLSLPNRRAAGVILIPALLVGFLAHYFPAMSARQDLRVWLAPVREQWQSGDVAYYTAVHTAISFSYYLPGEYRLRPHSSDLNQSLTEFTKQAMHFNQGKFDDLAGQGYKRAWLLTYTNPLSRNDEYEAIRRILSEYDAELIAREGSEHAEMLIYLIRIGRSK